MSFSESSSARLSPCVSQTECEGSCCWIGPQLRLAVNARNSLIHVSTACFTWCWPGDPCIHLEFTVGSRLSPGGSARKAPMSPVRHPLSTNPQLCAELPLLYAPAAPSLPPESSLQANILLHAESHPPSHTRRYHCGCSPDLAQRLTRLATTAYLLPTIQRSSS